MPLAKAILATFICLACLINPLARPAAAAAFGLQVETAAPARAEEKDERSCHSGRNTREFGWKVVKFGVSTLKFLIGLLIIPVGLFLVCIGAVLEAVEWVAC